MSLRLRKTFEKTRFANAPIVPVCALGGTNTDKESAATLSSSVQELVETLRQRVTQVPNRQRAGRFVCAVDHCFSVRGVGTILTGTVLSGTVTVGDVIDVPASGNDAGHRVKSIQVFHKPVQRAIQVCSWAVYEFSIVAFLSFQVKSPDRAIALDSACKDLIPTAWNAAWWVHRAL